MICKSCGFAPPEDFKFCPECGQKAVTKIACPACHTECIATSKFCPECGHSLAPRPVSVPSQAPSPLVSATPDTTLYDQLHEAYYHRILASIESRASTENLHELIRATSKGKTELEIKLSIDEALRTVINHHRNVERLTHEYLKEKVESQLISHTQVLKLCLERLDNEAENILSSIPNSESERFFQVMKAGIASEDAGWGLALGSFLPGIGNIVVAGIGGYLAATRLEERQQALLESYDHLDEKVREQIDAIWEKLYSEVCAALAELSILCPSLAEINTLYTRYNQHLEDGWARYEAADYGAAIQSALEAHDVLPREAGPHVLLGMSSFEMQQYAEATESLAAALECANLEVDLRAQVYFRLGECHKEQGRLPDALDFGLKVFDLDRERLSPENLVLAHFAISCYQALSGDVTGSLKSLKEAVDSGILRILKAEQIVEDPDLATCRGLPEFWDILGSSAAIESILFRHARQPKENHPALLVGPEMDQAKLKNAQTSYAKTKPNEKILGMNDSTVFGSAKDGACFTDRSICWKELWSEPNRIEYSCIRELNIKDDILWINGKAFKEAIGLEWTRSVLEEIVYVVNAGRSIDKVAEESKGTLETYYQSTCEAIIQGSMEGALQSFTQLINSGYLSHNAADSILTDEGLGPLWDVPTSWQVLQSAPSLRWVLARHIKAATKPEEFRQGDEIDPKKLQNAKSTYVKCGPDETVLCLYDSTFWGSAKDGVCWTDRGIYWKELWEDPHFFEYKYLRKLDIIDGHLLINGRAKLSSGVFTADWAKHLLEEVAAIFGHSEERDGKM